MGNCWEYNNTLVQCYCFLITMSTEGLTPVIGSRLISPVGANIWDNNKSIILSGKWYFHRESSTLAPVFLVGIARLKCFGKVIFWYFDMISIKLNLDSIFYVSQVTRVNISPLTLYNVWLYFRYVTYLQHPIPPVLLFHKIWSTFLCQVFLEPDVKF